MTDIPDRPFGKIVIDLVSDLNVSASGNQHILTIIDHLTGWQEAFCTPDKKADTIVHIFINNYLPIHMCSSSYCQTMALNSGISQWTMFSNNLALTASFPPCITECFNYCK